MKLPRRPTGFCNDCQKESKTVYTSHSADEMTIKIRFVCEDGHEAETTRSMAEDLVDGPWEFEYDHQSNVAIPKK